MSGITARTRLAAVVGRPVAHSLSPLLHNAWIAAAGIDAAYLALSPTERGFASLVEGLRGGAMAGVNVTVPFKEQALAAADIADAAARAAGAANLLLFHGNGRIEARNTDGLGLLAAFAEQAPGFAPSAGPVVVLGAGGAARGAVAALIAAGCPEIRIVNRTHIRAEALAASFGSVARAVENARDAFEGVSAIVNATSAGLEGAPAPDWPLDTAPKEAVAMDMVYKPLRTAFLRAAEARGLAKVDGLGMLIGQARPSFEALFGVAAARQGRCAGASDRCS